MTQKKGKKKMKRKRQCRILENRDMSCQYIPFIHNKDATTGITLVALVVTIVVLLILAGITITYVFGDNSVFKQASEAKLKTKLASIEEEANLIYVGLVTEKYADDKKIITLTNIVDKMTKSDYKIISKELEIEEITEVAIKQSEVKVVQGGTEVLDIVLNGSEEGKVYYVEYESKYYEMKLQNGAVTVNRQESNLDTTNPDEIVEVKIKTGYDTDIITKAELNESKNKITIIAGTINGSTEIRVTYGKKESESCKVMVAPKATKITADPLIITEETKGKINVVVTPSEAITKLKYEVADIDKEKITVSSTGEVEANALIDNKTSDTATVNITDELSGKTTTCSITIQNLIGAFVKYNVEYTDMYNNYNYTEKNGWRLLKYTKNEDGTFGDVTLISTGIPARMRIQCSKYLTENDFVLSNSSDNKKVFEDFINVLTSNGTSTYPLYTTNVGNGGTGMADFPALRLCEGLYNRFENVKFEQSSTNSNYTGFYKTITTGGVKIEGDALGSDLFKIDSMADKVRLWTLAEVNQFLERKNGDYKNITNDSKGLFSGNDLSKLTNFFGQEAPSRSRRILFGLSIEF